MKRRLVLSALAVVVAVGGVLAAPGSGFAARSSGHTNVAIDWNAIMLGTFATAGVAAPVSTRMGAIVQAAVFDAVNGIETRYTPIHVAPAAPDGSSPQAAVIGASYTAQALLFPAQKAALNADLAASIAAISDDGSEPSVANGLAWGTSVASQIVAWRSTDGFTATLPLYVFGTAPGDWQMTVGGSGPPKFRTLATTTPFALTSPSQFRPAGPPALDSAKYATDLKEVKAIGSATSTVRTTDQMVTAKFWQADTPIDMWDRVADSLAQENHFNLMRTARLLAFLNIAEADAAIAVWDAKNKFNFWRPETAIGDPTWAPLLPTPYFQEYPSGHSGVSSAAATILASFFGPDAQFTVTSNGLPGVNRSFTSFSGAIAQVADARVFAGFHFRFSCNDATQMGVQVANYAESTLMQKVSDESD
jgi:hypothetical protein